jgi:eukaryotic-like serine/threonine-protein kinase
VRTDHFIGQTIRSEFHSDVGFRIERLLGQGATARAYYAIRQAPEGRCPVVLKIILPEVVREGKDAASLFIRKESVALGRLNERIPRSPNVVRLIETGTVAFPLGAQMLSLPWLALEYVHGGIEGTCLDERVAYAIRSTGMAFEVQRAARTIEALASGLEEIHAVGVVHRDLTPNNVLCCGSGDTELFKISDFGIARPMGLGATFGSIVVGTPGYIPPEQAMATEGALGPATDVFSFAAIVYSVLTGEHYFRSRSASLAYQEIIRPERRSLAEASALCPELRQRPAALTALDLALARATSPEPEARPQSARLFADGILPWLGEPVPPTVSARWLSSFEHLAPQTELPEHEWLVRHAPGDDRVILSAAWNAAGHCLAATTTGLQYFDGTAWAAVPQVECLAGRQIQSVRRLAPTTWVTCWSGGRIAQVAGDATTLIADAPDQGIDLLDVDGDLDDLCVFLGTTREGVWVLSTRVGRRWLRPFPVPNVLAISALTRLDDERWLVVGRSDTGHAWAAIHSPLALTLAPINVPSGRALLDCTSRRGRNLAVAVGGDGGVLVVEGKVADCQTIESRPNLSAVTMDVGGLTWMASMGSIWHRSRRGRIDRVWHEPRWQSPFINVHAELGCLVALSVDGGVLEGRVNLLGPTMLA